MQMKCLTVLFFALALSSSLVLNAQNKLTPKEKKDGWELLFDGKTTKGWRGAFIKTFPAEGWQVKNGEIMVEAKNGEESTNGGDIVTEKLYSDFELLVDFKITEGANSGIKYFVDPNQPVPENPRSALGLEFQVLDDVRHPDAKIGKNGNRTIGSLYDLIPASPAKVVNAIGQWNTARIISKGHHVEHWLNGVMVVAYERGSQTFKDLIAGSKYKGISNFGLIPRGRILLQDHGNQVFFRNIKIREFKNQNQSFGKTLDDVPGMVSYTYRNSFQKDVAATLDTIRRMGITNIEFSNLFGKSAVELRKLLDERGLRCTSFGVQYPDIINNIKEVGKNAQTLGASFVRVAWIPHDANKGFTIDDAKKAVEDFNTAGKILKEEFDLTFCYHNHGYEFTPYNNQTLLDYMMANTKPEYVSFEMDILWTFHGGGDAVQLLNKHGNRFKLMHLKDLKKGVKGDLTGRTSVDNDVALGTGQINLSAIIQAAKKSSIEHYYIEDESNNVNVQVPQSIAYLQKL